MSALLKHDFVAALEVVRLPSEQLAAVQPIVDGIEYETRPGVTELYRWTCTCGKRGVWLAQPEAVRRNGTLHAQWHAEGAP